MSAQGFCKKAKYQKKLKKLVNILEDAESLREKGIDYEKMISLGWMNRAEKIREQSKQAYGHSLITARSLMVTALCDLLVFREGVPGRTNESLGDMLQLVVAFWQGQFCTEQIISEGGYIKAAAIIKQEIEMIARIAEIKKGVARDGKTPNVKYAPSKLNLHYGDMNEIAHISKPIILACLGSIVEKTFVGASISPIFHEGLARSLYEIHLAIFYNIVLEAMALVC